MDRLRRAFLAPGVVTLSLLFVAPLAIILLYSFQSRGVYGGVAPEFTGDNYSRIADGLYGAIFLRTFVLAGVATVGCLLLGFPLALFISRAGKRRNLYLQLVMLPFWSSFLVRTYAWMVLLRDTGLINTALTGLGLIREPLPLLYNDGAVFVGLVYGYLPFVVLPLYATLERLDKSLTEAAADLGASPWQTLIRVIVPLCAPGFRAAAVLVFIPCLGAYLTPDLLGGGKTVMAGNLIQNQFTTARDWPFGSAVALVLMLLSLVLLVVWMRTQSEDAL
ncbi:MAG: ABC transporter permease [Bryobacteraceae bacterium]|nr:ABC transporter permease [Bryobacteraceae bacterium]